MAMMTAMSSRAISSTPTSRESFRKASRTGSPSVGAPGVRSSLTIIPPGAEQFDCEVERFRARAPIKEDEVKRATVGENILPLRIERLDSRTVKSALRNRKPLGIGLDRYERRRRSEGPGDRLRAFTKRRAKLGNPAVRFRCHECREQRLYLRGSRIRPESCVQPMARHSPQEQHNSCDNRRDRADSASGRPVRARTPGSDGRCAAGTWRKAGMQRPRAPTRSSAPHR